MKKYISELFLFLIKLIVVSGFVLYLVKADLSVQVALIVAFIWIFERVSQSALDRELEFHKERIDGLEGEIETLRQEVYSLESKIDNLETTVEELQTNLSNLKTVNDSF